MSASPTWSTASRFSGRSRSRTISRPPSRTRSWASSPSTSRPTCGSSRAASSSCCSPPRSGPGSSRCASPGHRETTADLPRGPLADKIRPGQEGASAAPKTSPTIDKVQDVVARRWGVTPEGLRSKARIKTLTVPRQIAMYLAREVLQMQLVEIGQAFGGRYHSTVIHSVDKVQRQLQRDRQFRERVESARQELYAP